MSQRCRRCLSLPNPTPARPLSTAMTADSVACPGDRITPPRLGCVVGLVGPVHDAWTAQLVKLCAAEPEPVRREHTQERSARRLPPSRANRLAGSLTPVIGLRCRCAPCGPGMPGSSRAASSCRTISPAPAPAPAASGPTIRSAGAAAAPADYTACGRERWPDKAPDVRREVGGENVRSAEMSGLSGST